MIFWFIYLIVVLILLSGLYREVKAQGGEVSRGAIGLAVFVILIPIGNIMLLFMAIIMARHERKLTKGK